MNRLVGLLLLLAPPLWSNPTITFAFGFSPQKEPLYRYFDEVYTEAFRRLGYEFAYEVVPLARATTLAEAGDVDGEPQRLSTYGDAHPTMVRVEADIVTTRTLVVTADPSLHWTSWDDLVGYRGSVGYLTGAVRTQTELSRRLPSAQVLAVASVQQGIEMVRFGRLDAFVDLDSRLLPIVPGSLLVIGPVDVSPSYPYLNRRWAALAVPLARVLAQMKAEGWLRQALVRALPELGR